MLEAHSGHQGRARGAHDTTFSRARVIRSGNEYELLFWPSEYDGITVLQVTTSYNLYKNAIIISDAASHI